MDTEQQTMDARAMELWSHAPNIIEKLSAAIKQPGKPIISF